MNDEKETLEKNDEDSGADRGNEAASRRNQSSRSRENAENEKQARKAQDPNAAYGQPSAALNKIFAEAQKRKAQNAS